MQHVDLVVIVGGSGTGKSTLARAMQERLLPEPWLHFSVDTVLYCLPPSLLTEANTRNDWTSIDTAAVARSAYACLHALLAQGNRVLFECVVMTERRAREVVSALQAYRPVVVGLSCSWEETQRRTVARADRTLAEAERGFKTAGAHLDFDYRIDTTGRDPHDVALQLVNAMSRQLTHDAWARNQARLLGNA